MINTSYQAHYVYITIILCVILHEYETLPHKQREEHGLKESDNRMLGRIFRSQRDEIMDLEKLHNEQLRDFS